MNEHEFICWLKGYIEAAKRDAIREVLFSDIEAQMGKIKTVDNLGSDLAARIAEAYPGLIDPVEGPIMSDRTFLVDPANSPVYGDENFGDIMTRKGDE